MIEVKRIEPEMTYNIRQIVLRPHQAIGDSKYNNDHEDTAFHVGAFHQRILISVASFVVDKHPDFPLKDNIA